MKADDIGYKPTTHRRICGNTYLGDMENCVRNSNNKILLLISRVNFFSVLITTLKEIWLALTFYGQVIMNTF